MEFAKIALDRLKGVATRFKVKLSETIIDAMIKAIREQFRKQILPSFINDGRDWAIDLEMPQGFPMKEEHQSEFRKFSNATVLECFQPSVSRIGKMLIDHILQLCDPPYVVSVSVSIRSLLHVKLTRLEKACVISWTVCIVELSL